MREEMDSLKYPGFVAVLLDYSRVRWCLLAVPAGVITWLGTEVRCRQAMPNIWRPCTATPHRAILPTLAWFTGKGRRQYMLERGCLDRSC